MSTYLIDFENVKSSGLNGIDRIKEGDSVQLFWSKRENKITIEMMEMIRKSPCEIVMHKAETGERDALDHQLCSYLGYLAGATGETSFVIVSNDKAYDYLIDFWKKLNPTILIRRFPEIINAVENEKPADLVSEKVVLATEVEMVAGESKGGRNNRRKDRDRNGKYLKNGGRNGRRGDRLVDNTESTNEVVAEVKVEETAEIKVEAVEAEVEKVEAEVVETSGNPALDAIVNAAFSAIEVRKASRQAESLAEAAAAEETKAEEVKAEEAVVEEPVAEEVKRPVVKLPVVGNITSSVVHNTGSRADGIMTGYQPKESVETKVSEEKADYKAEEAKVEEVDEAEALVPETDAPVEEAAETVEAVEVADGVEETQPVQESAEVASEAVRETAEEAGTEAVEEVTEAVAEETVAEEAVVEEVVAEEAGTEEKAVAEVETPEAEEKPEKPKRRKRSPRKKKTEEVEVTETAAPVENAEAEKETESDKPVKADKRRGRPVKTKSEEKNADKKPEDKKVEKKPVTKEDVLQRIEDAKDADWTDDVVNLINSASDKKELYASIVKRLGQEQGRPVYHAIKSLK